jgi:hypothetical protein
MLKSKSNKNKSQAKVRSNKKEFSRIEQISSPHYLGLKIALLLLPKHILISNAKIYYTWR